MAEEGESFGEYDWIFDYVMSVFKSPLWDLTVMGIIDDNCIVFSNEEENRFEYTDIHNLFKLQVEQLLTQHLAELGVSEDMFLEACERARSSRDINQEVYDQIVAMEDFLTFKKLMVKRNMELELEAVRELQKEGVPLIAPADEEAAAAAFQREVKQADELTPAEAKEAAQEGEGEEAAQAKAGPKEGAELHAQVLEEMDGHLMEMELLHKKEEMEQMELERAIAMSLALEEERLRIARLEAKAEGLFAGFRENCDRLASSSSESPPPVGASPDPVPKPGRPRAPLAGDDKPEPGAGAGGAGSKLPPVSKMKPVNRLPERNLNLPSLSELQEQMDSKRRQAQEAFRKNQEMLKQQLDAQEALKKQAGVSQVDMERRAKYLKEQRDRILAKKKAEREAKLKEEQEKEAARKAQMAEEIAKRAPEVAGGGGGGRGGGGGGEGKADDDPAEERRRLMRVALARRMKQDLLENEEERMAKAQADQFNDLDAKLRLVEQLREENRQKEAELNRAVARQQQVRARNVQRSAARAQMMGEDDFGFAEGGRL